MIKRFFFFACGLLVSFNMLAQQAEILMTIGDQKISTEEFTRIYSKNNQNPAFDKASLEEYMDLFINFKLKVLEAEALGYDTLSTFTKELDGYVKQLEKPYFTDESVDSVLIEEAYNRLKQDVRASHILISCSKNTLAEDTLKAYNKAEKIYNRVLKGENFAKLAKTYSDDPSAQTNGGDLGYFTAFRMLYVFESAAYATEVGKVSPIIRSKYGYHIIKVTDKRPTKGRVKVAHIMRSVPDGSEPGEEEKQKQFVMHLYDSIQAGSDFGKMALKYSDDRGTSNKGGELPFFTVGQMVPEFETAAFALDSIGAISKPVKTSYGWHLIKLLKEQPLGTKTELESFIKGKISKDERAKRGQVLVVARLKNEYQFKEDKSFVKPLYAIVDSTIRKGVWNIPESFDLKEVLFTIADTNEYTQYDFAKFMENDGLRRSEKWMMEIIVDDAYRLFVEKSLLNFESARLPIKYPEFKHLLQEYHDGILLFNLTDEKVWSKAIEDSVGLEAFYAENKQNYLWSDRLKVSKYSFNDSTYNSKVLKLAQKISKKGLDSEEQSKLFSDKINLKDSAFTLQVETKKYIKGDADFVDALTWEAGYYVFDKKDGNIELIFVDAKVLPEPKTLNEARGLITADYQNYLEKVWMTELRAKYNVEINDEVFNKLVK